MRLYSILLNSAPGRILRRVFPMVFTAALLFFISQTASAQCFPNPTGETAVGLQNASSYFLTFYIDGVSKGGVPAGDKSVDFIVTPGEHTLRAAAVISGETVWATRVADVPSRNVCTWTVTDPQAKSDRKAKGKLTNRLRRK